MYNSKLIFTLTLPLFLEACQANVSKNSPQVVTEEPCKTVATLGPTLTELIYLLGEEEKLLGVSRFDKLPVGEQRPQIGGLFDPSLETIARLKPQCLLYVPVTGGVADLLTPLNRLDIRTVELPAASLADLENTITKLSGLLENPEKGRQLLKNMAAERAKLLAAARQWPSRRVVIVYGVNPLVAAGRGSLGDELLQISGWQNLVGGTGFPVLDEEFFIKAAPDLLLDLSQNKNSRELFKKILPAKTKVVTINEEALLHPTALTVKVWLAVVSGIEEGLHSRTTNSDK